MRLAVTHRLQAVLPFQRIYVIRLWIMFLIGCGVGAAHRMDGQWRGSKDGREGSQAYILPKAEWFPHDRQTP